jgi:RimJ/RimL family protein N-acetyltransferase
VPPPITFRATTEADIELLARWLATPEVARWWIPTPPREQIRAELVTPPNAPPLPLDTAAGWAPFLACEGGEPFGYIQAYRVVASHADGFWLDQTDPFALGIDQFIGVPERIGRGLGTRMVRAFVARLFEDPRVTSVQTDPSPDNARAIACYRKAGFRDVGAIATPDGPSLLMRIER